MNIVSRSLIALAALLTVGTSAFAQEESTSTLVRRSGGGNAQMLRQSGSMPEATGGESRSRFGRNNRNAQPEAQQPAASERMKSFFQDEQLSDADLQWMRVIYRQLDLRNAKNAALYYPEDVIDGQENLFRIIMRLVADGKVPAYEYLDGREVFTDANRLKVKDMLERFYITAQEARGSSEKNPRFVIEESDVPTNEVLSYYIIERWEFDSRNNRMKTRVEAICPVLHRAGEWGGDEVKYPMFWVRLENLRPYLAQQYIFVDDDNNLATYTYDDFFAMNMYDGEIYKTRNLQNKSMAQLYTDPDDLKRAQDSIQHRLDTYAKGLWVPTREEVIAAREAREAAANGDSVVIKSRDEKVKKAAARTRSRAKKEKDNTPKVKQPKSTKDSGSSNAVRSVRRRK